MYGFPSLCLMYRSTASKESSIFSFQLSSSGAPISFCVCVPRWLCELLLNSNLCLFTWAVIWSSALPKSCCFEYDQISFRWKSLSQTTIMHGLSAPVAQLKCDGLGLWSCSVYYVWMAIYFMKAYTTSSMFQQARPVIIWTVVKNKMVVPILFSYTQYMQITTIWEDVGNLIMIWKQDKTTSVIWLLDFKEWTTTFSLVENCSVEGTFSRTTINLTVSFRLHSFTDNPQLPLPTVWSYKLARNKVT